MPTPYQRHCNTLPSSPVQIYLPLTSRPFWLTISGGRFWPARFHSHSPTTRRPSAGFPERPPYRRFRCRGSGSGVGMGCGGLVRRRGLTREARYPGANCVYTAVPAALGRCNVTNTSLFHRFPFSLFLFPTHCRGRPRFVASSRVDRIHLGIFEQDTTLWHRTRRFYISAVWSHRRHKRAHKCPPKKKKKKKKLSSARRCTADFTLCLSTRHAYSGRDPWKHVRANRTARCVLCPSRPRTRTTLSVLTYFRLSGASFLRARWRYCARSAPFRGAGYPFWHHRDENHTHTDGRSRARSCRTARILTHTLSTPAGHRTLPHIHTRARAKRTTSAKAVGCGSHLSTRRTATLRSTFHLVTSALAQRQKSRS